MCIFKYFFVILTKIWHWILHSGLNYVQATCKVLRNFLDINHPIASLHVRNNNPSHIEWRFINSHQKLLWMREQSSRFFFTFTKHKSPTLTDLCFSLYQIEEPTSHPMQMMWMAIYLTCMLIEVFILCWFGDELIWKVLYCYVLGLKSTRGQ